MSETIKNIIRDSLIGSLIIILIVSLVVIFYTENHADKACQEAGYDYGDWVGFPEEKRGVYCMNKTKLPPKEQK